MDRLILGSLYFCASEKFGCGYMQNIYKTLKAEKDDLGILEMEVKVIGQMDNTMGNTFESANRVYDVGGYLPQSILVEVVDCNRRLLKSLNA